MQERTWEVSAFQVLSGIFYLNHNTYPVLVNLHQYIAVAVSGLMVGEYAPGFLKTEQSHQNTVVKIFFSARISVPDADRSAQIGLKQPLSLPGVSLTEGLTEGIQRPAVPACAVLKPGKDLGFEDIADFRVGDYKLPGRSVPRPFERQVSCGKEYTPHIFNGIIKLFISQLLTELFLYGFSGNQSLNFPFRRTVGQLQKMADNLIPAGIRPVGFRLCFPVSHQSVTVADHIPGTVNIRVAEMVSIIPIVKHRIEIGQSVIFQQLPHL